MRERDGGREKEGGRERERGRESEYVCVGAPVPETRKSSESSVGPQSQARSRGPPSPQSTLQHAAGCSRTAQQPEPIAAALHSTAHHTTSSICQEASIGIAAHSKQKSLRHEQTGDVKERSDADCGHLRVVQQTQLKRMGRITRRTSQGHVSHFLPYTSRHLSRVVTCSHV